jgi:hypothetical protein
MAELHSNYPSSPSDNRKKASTSGRYVSYNGRGKKSRTACQPIHLRPLPTSTCSSTRFGWQFPDISGRQKVYHRLVAFLYREQFRDFHVSATAHSLSRLFSHLFPAHLLQVFRSAAVAKDMFPCLGCPDSCTTSLGFVIVLVSQPC